MDIYPDATGMGVVNIKDPLQKNVVRLLLVAGAYSRCLRNISKFINEQFHASIHVVSTWESHFKQIRLLGFDS